MNPSTLLDSIRDHLTKTAGLDELDRASFPLAAGREGTRSFRLADSAAAKLHLQIDRHFPLDCHGLVLDEQLGSIGIVHLLLEPDSITETKADTPARSDATETDAKKSPEKLKDAINRLLEEAAYLRHLLALKRSAAPDPMSVLLPAIEVVFLVGTHPDIRSALSEHLRTSLQESALLHALSVNMVPADTSDPARLALQLQRAFCWLLPATRAWLSGLTSAAPTPLLKWNRLRLENFRRPGVRNWDKTVSAARLHVIHGPNGSGKSTLAEGFEYAVTGDSTRLKKASGPANSDRYAPLVYRDSAAVPARAAAAALIHAEPPANPDGKKPDATKETTLLTRSVPPAPGGTTSLSIPGGALRLDQRLVDQLSLHGPATRARVWLETFLSDFDRHSAARREARQTLRSAVSTLAGPADAPAAARLFEALVARAQHMADGKATSLAELVLPLLGPGAGATLDAARLGELGLQFPALLALGVSASSDSPETDWTPVRREELRKQAGEALVQDAAVLAHWQEIDHSALRQLLEALGRRGFDDSPSSLRARIDEGEDHPTTLNRYLRVVALLDLLERARAIARTAEGLPDGLADPMLTGIKPALGSTEIEAEAGRLQTEREILHRRLAAWRELERAERGETGPAALSETQLDQIRDAVEANVFSPRIAAEDALEFVGMLRHNRPGRLRDLPVGKDGWTEPLVTILHHREAAIAAFGENLLQRPSRAKRPGARVEERADALVALVDGVVAIARLEKLSEGRFRAVARTANLDVAIQELLALITPARWAYPALAVNLKIDEDEDQRGEGLELQSRGLDVGEVLNTAELNTLSIVFYLLCAPRVDNPWRVLFFDDSFQNMDELTVATVARGLARLLRLWKQVPGLADWEIVLLLNGEETCQRVLLEAPAAFYRLPWLPLHGDDSHSPKDDNVASAPGTELGKLLPLGDIFSEPRA